MRLTSTGLTKNSPEVKIQNMKKIIFFILIVTLISSYIPVWGISTNPLDVSCDAYGNLFVLDVTGQKVQKFDKNLNFVGTVLTKDKFGADSVSSVTVCWCAGEIVIASKSDGQTRMFEVDAKWAYNFKRKVADVGTGKGQVKNPGEIVYLRSNDDYWIAVSDPTTKKVVVIDDYGKLKYEVTGLTNPKSVYYSTSKQLHIADGDSIRKYTSEGKLQSVLAQGKLKNPLSIDASKNEDLLFVLDGGDVKVFDKNGNYLRQFGPISAATSLCVNQANDWVMVASSNDGGALFAYNYSGSLQKTFRNAANPAKQTTLNFTIGSYVYQVGGSSQKLRCPAKIEDGRTLVPLREITEPLGGAISWDSKTRKITISYSNPKKIELTIDNPNAYVDGKKVLLPSGVPPKIYCGSVTMVPLRFVSETLGATINYDSAKKTIEVKK